MVKTQRYTLSLPESVYMALDAEAKKRDVSINTIIRQCLKVGLLALKAEEDDSAELIYREWVVRKEDGEKVARDRVLMIMS